MTNDIHAAAERWKRVRNGEEIKDVYGMMKPDWTPAQLSADCDACDLADAYCELLDDTPIDEEWARKIEIEHGVKIGTNMWGWYFDTPGVRAGKLKTRSQVRALLLAMGVKQETRGDA